MNSHKQRNEPTSALFYKKKNKLNTSYKGRALKFVCIPQNGLICKGLDFKAT